MNNDPIPDFILNNQNDYSNEVNTFGGQASNDPIPDFIKNQEEDIVVSPKRNLKDEEVKTQLGVDFDDSFSSDSKQVKEYVDSLSDDDYELRDQRREEGYSLDARKALMDNRELVNSEPGNLKYKINSPDLGNRALNYIQNLNEGYEKIHPWNKSAQEWLDEATMFMEEKLGKENLMNKRIDKNDPYSKMGPKAAEQTINSYETFVNLVQIPKILGQTLTYSSSKILNIIDQIQNQKAAIPAEIVDLYQKIQGKEPIFNIQYDEERSNPIGSSIQIIKDGLGVGFVIAYPVATYLMSLLGSTNQDIQNVEKKVYNKAEGLFQYLLNLDGAQNLIEIAGLNAKDEESLVEGLTDGLFLIGGALAPKLFRNRTVELHKEAFKQANNFAKKYGKYKTREGFAAKEAAGQLPVGTEILNKKGKPIAVSTPEGGRFTTRGALETGLQGAKGYAEMFKNYWKWFYQNYNKRNVNRNPYAPVGELPNIVGTETQTGNPTKVVEGEKVKEEVKEELTPERETEVKEKGFYTDEEPIIKTPKKVTPKESGVSIGEFIKKNINKITGKKGGLNKDLANKLQTSKDLQNEYVNTIDPYIRENGTNNPGGVIQEQLTSLVDSVKDKIIERKVNNQIFRRGQKQYKVEITEEEKKNQKIEDEKLKKLLKAMEKQSDSPEELLKYLLNLPKETVEEFNKMIPDFSQNLSLIKDTLDITKAITKPDVIDKFLEYKSKWRLKNKGFLKRLFYSYLKEKYKEQGLKANMRELETLINQLSEEELKQRAEAMQTEDADFPVGVNNSLRKITDFGGPRAGKPYKKSLEQGYGNMIPKGAVYDELVYEGYRSDEFENDQYLAEKNKGDLNDILNTKYSNGTTPKDWIDFYNIGLKGVEPGWLPFGINAQSLSDGVIQFRNNLKGFNAWILGHEIRHQVKGHLTTKELFDFYNNIVKSTQSLRKYEGDSERDNDMKAISEYMSLDRTRAGIEEYIADSFAQVLYKGDLHELEDFLPTTIWSLDLSEKVNNIFSQIAKDLRDNLSAFETENGKYSTQVDELKNMLDKVSPSEKNKHMSERRYEDWQPMMKNVAGRFILDANNDRLIFLRSVEPKLSKMKYDLDINSNKLGTLMFEMEDGRKLTWDEFKNTLSEEQLKQLDNDTVLGENERRENLKRDEQTIQNSIANISPKFSKYSKALNKIDPDILGLVEKDGQIYVKYLIESQRERYELPDRPGYVEVKEVPAKDYFTEEELNQLPKKLKEMISDGDEKDVIQLQKDLDYWHHRAMKAERGSEDPDDYLDLENRKYDENSDIEQIQKDIDYRHHRAMVAERGEE